MASVRTTAPRREDAASASNKKKRKRSAAAKPRGRAAPPTSLLTPSASPAGGESDAAVDGGARQQLAALVKWQLCTQQNLSEIRAECMKVRRELEKVELAADTAVGQVQDEAADARAARQQAETHAKAAVSYVEAIQRDVEAAAAAAQTELQGVKKKVRALEQSLQELGAQSIDEDFLMTQLAELQERSENELTKRREEYAAQFQDKQQALDALKAQLQQVATAGRQERDAVSSVAAVLEAQVAALANRVLELERERQRAESSRVQLKTELEDASRRLDRKQEEMEQRLERKLNDMFQQYRQQQQQQNAPPPLPLPPAQYPQPPLPQQHQPHHDMRYPPRHEHADEHPATAEKLHRLSRDVHLIGEDLHRLTKRVEVRNGDLHVTFTKKLGDLASEVFNALEFDAHRHTNEHKRLHDMIESSVRDLCGLRDSVDRRIRDLMNFSIQDLQDSMKRMEENLRHIAAERRSRAPPDVVLEDEDTQPRTIVIHESVDSASDDDMPGGSQTSPDRLRTLSDIRLGSLLYFCYGGAPDLDAKWTRYFASLGANDCIEMSRAANFLRRYPGLHSFSIYLAQFIVQAIVVEAPGSGAQGLGLSDDSQPVRSVGPELVRVEFHKVLDKIRLAWAEVLTSKLRKLSELSPQTAECAQFSVNPALAASNGRAVVGYGSEDQLKLAAAHSAWRRWQAESLWRLVRQHRFGANIPAFDGDMVASPGVYVFLLMFDPVGVSQLSPQRASFRLTNWGRALVIQLWDHLLLKLPYLLFADCSWLEKQTDTIGTLPPLGFCHMLGAVLAWNSFADKDLAYSAELYSESVRLLLGSLRVRGVPVKDQEGVANITLDEATEIELVDVTTNLVYALQLDGFFEAAHAILVQTSFATVATTAVAAEMTTTEALESSNISPSVDAPAIA